MVAQRSVVLIAIGLFVTAGCRPTADQSRGDETGAMGVVETSSDRAGSPPRVAPRDRLRQIFERYRTASSYRDRAVVEAQSVATGDRQTAPLAVWFDRGTLAVAAYDVRIRSQRSRLLARIHDEATDDFDSQVFQRITSASDDGVDRPALQALLEDPVLAERITGGLAGPPPQLEWLFADEPMSGLFDPAVTLRDDGAGTVEGRTCRRIVAEVDQERYRFWIDDARGMVRRIELPDVPLPAAAMGPVSDDEPIVLRVRVDLRDATFSPPTGPPPQFSLPERPKFVRRFVPLPPPEPPAELGRQLPPFAIEDVSGRHTLTAGRGQGDVTVLLKVGEDAVSSAALTELTEWVGQLPDPFRRRMRFALLADESSLVGESILSGGEWRSRLSEEEIAIFPDQVISGDRSISQIAGVGSGSLAVIDGRGRVAWRQPRVTAGDLVTLGVVLADLLDGVDVPSRVRDQWREAIEEYRDRLAEAAE